MKICKEWKALSNEENLWKRLCDYLGVYKPISIEKTWKSTWIEYGIQPKFTICGLQLKIFDSNKRVRVEAPEIKWIGFKSALTSAVATTGIHFWRIKLKDGLPGWLCTIGVINEDIQRDHINLLDSIENMPGSYSYRYNASFVLNGIENVCRETYNPGSEIGILINLNENYLIFFKNSHVVKYSERQEEKIKIEIVPGKYRLACSLDYNETELILLNNIPLPLNYLEDLE